MLWFMLPCILLVQADEIQIRSAQVKDFPILSSLSKRVIKEDFGAVIIKGYPDSPIAQDPILLDEYLYVMADCYNDLFDEKNNLLKADNVRFLVAIDQQKPENILGFCFSHKEDAQAYIGLLVIDREHRKRGIGSALLTQTINSHKGITSCALKTFSHGNEETQAFYEKYGFTSDKKAMPALTKITEHSDTLTFFLYQKKI